MVGDVFRAACDDLGTIAAQAKPDPVPLAERVFKALTHNDYHYFGRFEEPGELWAISPAERSRLEVSHEHLSGLGARTAILA
jgi:hypothetical protein